MAAPDDDERIRRVLVLSADIGSGHMAASRSLAADLEERGLEVAVVEDLRSSLGPLGRLLIRDGSRVLFDHAPRVYDVFYRSMLRFPPARASSAAWLRRFGARRLLRLVRRHDPSVVVSTYPGITVVLGELRRRRRLTVPVAAVITDVAGLFFWAHRGVDMHLLAWAESAPEVRRISRAGNVVHVLAPTDGAFQEHVDCAGARARLGLPAAGRIVLVSGGGWGVGRLADTVAAALAAGPDLVIALAGGNESARLDLWRRFGGEPRVHVLGYTNAMSELLAAADVLVHATGGVTCLEAALRGCPTILHGFSVGHVRHNAEVMTALGLVSRARNDAELTRLIQSKLASPPTARAPSARAVRPSAADAVMDVRPRIRPLPQWRLRTRRLAPAVSVMAALLMGTGTGYAVAARVEDDVGPVSHVATARPEAAVVVRPSTRSLGQLIDRLAAARLHVTLALPRRPGPELAAMASAAGVEIVPALSAGFHSFRPSASSRAVAIAGGDRDVPYVVPDRGFTFGQYLAGRLGDGIPVLPLHEGAGAVRQGDVVDVSGWRDVTRLDWLLGHRGIRLTTLGVLLRDSSPGPG